MLFFLTLLTKRGRYLGIKVSEETKKINVFLNYDQYFLK